MFDDEKIKLIDAMPERDTIFYIWMRLLVQAGKTNANGYIFLNENVPYTEEMLSTILNRQLNSVRLALQALKTYGMIEISENHLIKISNWEKHQNVEGMEKIREQNRLRKRNQRSRIKELQSPSAGETAGTDNNSHVMSRDSHAIEVEEEVDIEGDKDITTSATTEKVHVDNVDKSDYIMFFNSNMGHLMTPHELEIFNSFTEDGMEKSVITLAIEESIEANARDMRYIKSILNRWLTNGLKTFEAVMADKRNWEDKKKAKEQKTQYNKTAKVDTFNNYQQRDYDFDDLERKLLGRDVQEGDNH